MPLTDGDMQCTANLTLSQLYPQHLSGAVSMHVLILQGAAMFGGGIELNNACLLHSHSSIQHSTHATCACAACTWQVLLVARLSWLDRPQREWRYIVGSCIGVGSGLYFH